MSDWTRDTAIEVVTRLIDLTQLKEVVWKPSDSSPPLTGRATTPPFYADHKDKRWRIQGEVRTDKQLVSLLPRDRHYNVVNLELVDERDRTLLSVPDVPNLGRLLRAVQRQYTKADDVLEELFG